MRLSEKTTSSFGAPDEKFLSDIDFTSLSFILQNLQLANEELHSDPTLTISSRNYISRSTCLQICFYLSLALKSFTRPPTILLFGAGHTGSALIDYLVECKLGPCLRIFARGDYATKHWISKKLLASSLITELLGENKADIVIMCSGMSSFGHICRSVVPFVSRATFFISSCFGLSRKRIFNSLKTPNVFRTFQEPKVATTKCNLPESKKGYEDYYSWGLGAENSGLNTPGDGKGDGKVINGPLSFEQQSADLIVKRCPNLRNMIFLLENYYALRGMTHTNARKVSIGSLLGRNTDMVVHQEMPYQGRNQYCSPPRDHSSKNTPPMSPAAGCMTSMTALDMWTENDDEDDEDDEVERKLEATRVSKPASPHETHGGHTIHSRKKKESIPTPAVVIVKKKKIKGPTGLVVAQRMLQQRVAGPFQRHLSRFIRVSDIPRGFDVERIDPLTVQAKLLRRITFEEIKLMEGEDINRIEKDIKDVKGGNSMGDNSIVGTLEMMSDDVDDPASDHIRINTAGSAGMEGVEGDLFNTPRSRVISRMDSNKPNILWEKGLGFGTRAALLEQVMLSSLPEAAMISLQYILPHVPSVRGVEVEGEVKEEGEGEMPYTDMEMLMPKGLPQLVAESQYDAKRRQLEELRLMTKAKMLEELDNAPKTKEPLGAAMHSDDVILLIFGEDSLFHDDPSFPYDESNKVKSGPEYDLKIKKTQELMVLLREIEAEEDKHPGQD